MHNLSRRFALRERTSHDHTSLDQLVGPVDSLSSYRRYLLGVAAFRIPAEAVIAQIDLPRAFGTWRPHVISDLIRADLCDLNLAPPTTGACPMDPPKRIEELAGLLYVLEGSALGARLLSRQAGLIGLDGGFGARHLSAQAASGNWRSFLDILENLAPFELDSAVIAARFTFSSARDAFESLADAEH
jgi:heme oxygenase (biliverdin-IX-beta and delta-forming)